MHLTTRGRFAVAALMDLALREEECPVALADVSVRRGISLSYLEQLFSKLRRSGLVKSVRGPGGGYCLGKSLSQISVADIICAVDDRLDATQCGGHANCRGDQSCITHDLWVALNGKISEYLDSVSLADLARQYHEKPDALKHPHAHHEPSFAAQ